MAISSKSSADSIQRRTFRIVSLVVIGVIAIICSFFSLGMVIDALITTRILIQFIGQILAVTLLRRNEPELKRPYRIWLYPIPNLLALFGWMFVFATTDWTIIAFGLGTLLLGFCVFPRLVAPNETMAFCDNDRRSRRLELRCLN